MSSAILSLTGLQHTQIDLAPLAVDLRDKLVLEAASIQAISDAVDADATASVIRDLHTQIKACESARVDIGKPVLDLTRKINATAKSYSDPLQKEYDRLSRLLGIYQQAEREKAEKGRREAEEEARRIADEEARKVAETAAEHGENAPETEAAHAAAVDRVTEARVAVVQASAVQPKGVALRQPWKFEVTDIKALFAARPDLCVIEPNNAAIRAQIPYNQNIPGLRIWQEAKATIR